MGTAALCDICLEDETKPNVLRLNLLCKLGLEGVKSKGACDL